MKQFKTNTQYLLVLFVFISTPLNLVQAICQNTTQMELIYNQTNSSELIALLNQLCNENTNLKGSISSVNISLNEMGFVISEVNGSLSLKVEESRNYTKEVNESLFTRISQERNHTMKLIQNLNDTLLSKSVFNIFLENNASDYATKQDLDEFDEQIQIRKRELTDMWDEKISSLRKSYLSLEDYQNHSSQLKSEIYRMVNRQLSVWDRYAWYIFLSVVMGLGVIIAMLKFKPSIIRKPIIKHMKPEIKTVEDLTSQSELKARIDRMRKLKLMVVTNKELNRKEKITLLKKIDNNEVWDEDTLKAETELLLKSRKLHEGKK